ncbi:glutaredoxin-like protein [Hypnocyclicus thermotrophus]|uniref:Glutaredoxin-like protein n=1 Tax=Hypnocyclicus thermotrophus TaxID=1627895 RepID=A0AA46E056_9FUSO|nr:thioredoxin family protein [Hypnocyclicus thermotrophus]TDT72352.1 glutaredoxin-like protein [Hypnocyclicus thermotrophus]
MSIFNDDIKSQLKNVLKDMENNVKIIFFGNEEQISKDTEEIIKEVVELTDKLSLESYNFKSENDKATLYGIDKAPGFTLLKSDNSQTRMKFYGPPAGYEINSFIFSLLEASGKEQDMPENLINQIKSIDKKVNIKVFIGLSCPHCPGAVIAAHKLALLNENIDAEMIEANAFNELSTQFGISSVPRIFFNDDLDLLGAQPLEKFIETINKL